jgi:hypothetical protein
MFASIPNVSGRSRIPVFRLKAEATVVCLEPLPVASGFSRKGARRKPRENLGVGASIKLGVGS